MSVGFPERVFVTGGSGFIGTNLIASLLHMDGVTVINYDLVKPREPRQEAQWVAGDILDHGRLQSAIADFRPHCIVHLAAKTDFKSEEPGYYAANRQGVANLIEASKLAKDLRLTIYASSRYVFGSGSHGGDDFSYAPINEYGRSKMDGEILVRNQPDDSKPWLIVRPTSIWGPWFDIPYRGFFAAVIRGVYRHPRGAVVRKSYGYVGNVVHQLERLMVADSAAIDRRAFFLADYAPLEVMAWANCIRRRRGLPDVGQIPLLPLKILALGGDVLQKVFGVYNPPLTTFRLKHLVESVEFDLSATEKVVGPLPFTLDTGVGATLDWLAAREKGAG